jgi:hypothetical protein
MAMLVFCMFFIDDMEMKGSRISRRKKKDMGMVVKNGEPCFISTSHVSTSS